MSNKRQYAIYKVDFSKLLFAPNKKPDLDNIKKKLLEISKWYSEISENGLKMHHYYILIVSKKDINDSNFEIFKWYIKQNLNKKIFSNINNSFIIFYYTKSNIYAISIKSWYLVLQDYCDEDFPINLLMRSSTPNFKTSETRQLSWNTYSNSEIFRNLNSFNFEESFGKIWKSLWWVINEDSLIKDYFVWEDLIWFAMKTSSFKLWKSLSLEEMSGLVLIIDKTLKTSLSVDQKEIFDFLNYSKKVKDKNGYLFNSFIESKLLNYIYWNCELDIDFCPYKNIDSFFWWINFILSENNVELSTYESYDYSKLFLDIRNNYCNKSKADVLKRLDTLKINYILDEDSNSDITVSHNFLKCLHWEFICDNNNYFFVDWNFYQLSSSFLELIDKNYKKSFIDKLSVISVNGIIPFIKYNNEDEGLYNELHLSIDDFYCCDRIFIWWKGWIELFDLVYKSSEITYIIHVKRWLDAKVRDACSQILNSAKIIEHDFESNNQVSLSKLYKTCVNYKWKSWYRNKVKNKITSVGKKTFLNTFSKKRVYVLLFLLWETLTDKNYINYKSNIARIELISILNSFKQKFDSDIKFCFI